MWASKVRRRSFIILLLMTTYTMANMMLFAVMGPVGREVGLNEFQIGLVFSSSALMFLFMSPIWGRISDKVGRRQVIILGLIASGCTTLVIAGTLDAALLEIIPSATAFGILLFARILYGLLCAGVQPASVVYMTDMVDSEKPSAGAAKVGLGVGLGTILGPAMAAGLVGFGLVFPLYLIAILVLTCSALVFFQLDEKTHRPRAANTPSPLSSENLRLYLIITLATYISLSAVQQTLPFRVQDVLSLSTIEASRMTGICFVSFAVSALGTQIVVIWKHATSPRLLMALGLPILLVGVVLYGQANSSYVFLASFVFVGMGTGLVQPSLFALTSLEVPREEQGAAAGRVQGSMAAAYIIGPLAGTLLYPCANYSSAVLASLFLCISIFAFWLRHVTSFRVGKS
jgi:MFS family permease